jgi:hypothetical protein
MWAWCCWADWHRINQAMIAAEHEEGPTACQESSLVGWGEHLIETGQQEQQEQASRSKSDENPQRSLRRGRPAAGGGHHPVHVSGNIARDEALPVCVL